MSGEKGCKRLIEQGGIVAPRSQSPRFLKKRLVDRRADSDPGHATTMPRLRHASNQSAPLKTKFRSSEMGIDITYHAPQAEFGGVEFYPNFASKAAVLVTRIAKNHPLPDGNKRLTWQCLKLFCVLNGQSLRASADEAVATIVAIAAGEFDEIATAEWIEAHITASS